ncbi:unnamed protein product [Closterium sp. Naga37s-1]|nr:unnamed protein product [Closterium sp. Naga37s-1]
MSCLRKVQNQPLCWFRQSSFSFVYYSPLQIPLCRFPTADSPLPDSPLPDPPLPDSPLPDSPLPDSPLPDSPLPDSPLPDSPLPDSPLPDSPLPDSPLPDSPLPDSPLPDSPLTDSPLPYSPLPDSPLPDSPLPDSPLPDSPLPDSPLPYSPLLDSPLPDSPLPYSPLPDSPLPDSPLPDSPLPDSLLPDSLLPTPSQPCCLPSPIPGPSTNLAHPLCMPHPYLGTNLAPAARYAMCESDFAYQRIHDSSPFAPCLVHTLLPNFLLALRVEDLDVEIAEARMDSSPSRARLRPLVTHSHLPPLFAYPFPTRSLRVPRVPSVARAAPPVRLCLTPRAVRVCKGAQRPRPQSQPTSPHSSLLAGSTDFQ